jgi:hypothetical protein
LKKKQERIVDRKAEDEKKQDGKVETKSKNYIEIINK